MTSELHVPEDLLRAFAEADLDSQVAVHIATHLDQCPQCATRAVSLDPLAQAFAAMPDPVVPTDLVAAIVEEASSPEPGLGWEIVVGSSLLAAAALLAVFLGDPTALMSRSAVIGSAMITAAGHLSSQAAVTSIGFAVAVLLSVGLGLGAARLTFPEARLS